MEDLRPGIEPLPLQSQHWILNLLHHRELPFPSTSNHNSKHLYSYFYCLHFTDEQRGEVTGPRSCKNRIQTEASVHSFSCLPSSCISSGTTGFLMHLWSPDLPALGCPRVLAGLAGPLALVLAGKGGSRQQSAQVLPLPTEPAEPQFSHLYDGNTGPPLGSV